MARWVRWNNPTIKPPFGAQIDWSNPITEGLVGCWLFNEYNSNLAVDLSLRHNSGTINGARWKGNGLYFNGSSGNVDCGNISEINNASKISIITQVQPKSLTADNTIISKGLFGGTVPVLIWRDDVGYSSGRTDIYSVLVYDGNNNTKIEGASYPDTNKHQISMTYNSNDFLRLYVDGIEDVYSPVASVDSLESNTYPFLIGEASGTKLNTFDGNIYHVYLFSRVLSYIEIKRLYHEPYSFFLYPQYWYLVDFGGINSKEYSSLYDILNKNEYNNKYDIQAKTEKNIKYDILAQNSYVSKYDILTKKETNVSYDILIKTDYNISYDILNRLTKEVSYDILSAKEYNSKYDLLNSLASSILYNILTKNEYNVIYDILGTTAIEYTIQYDILNSAQTNIVFDILSKKEANIKYDILASRTSNIIYDILAKTLTNIIYDILAKKETTFSYDIINKKEINFKYDILTAKLYTNIYNILTKSEYKILYDILSDIIIRPEVIFKLDKQDTIFKVGKINTIFKLK